jgi:membrane peptidoglycan carboxypeptidase
MSFMLGDLTRNVLRVTTSVSDHVFGPALETCARRAAQELQLPPYFVQQLFAVEDKRFFYHPGVDFLSVLRALFFNLGTAATRPHGASTITQQIYSNAARRKGSYRSTVGFKIAQSTWALKRTLTHSKLSVLKEYLDSLYFGRSYYGLNRAAEGYCGRIPRDLTIADSFFLVERIARPNKVSIPRVAILAERRPIASLLKADLGVIRQLAVLYERHFSCGEVIEICLERSLRKQVVPTSTYLRAVSSEP